MDCKRIVVAATFQRRIFVPAMILSILSTIFWASTTEAKLFVSFGVSYLFFAPVAHFIVYELSYPYEYYFYNNLGFSRVVLWVITISLATIILLITLFL